jgi:D-threo-aldose 1-dehydrogenase
MRPPGRAARLGLGTSALGGLYEAVQAPVAEATIDAAWSCGIRYFDTAPLYGSGLAEHRLGQALAKYPRADYKVSTKVGRLLQPGKPADHFVGAPDLGPVFDYSADGIRRSLEESLERLQLDHVDIALLHDPESHLDRARRAIEVLRQFVPAVGVGTNLAATATSLVMREEIDLVLLAGRYTLLDRSAEEQLLPLCAAKGVPVVAAGVFNSGVLAGGSTFDYEAAPDGILARRDELERRCTNHGVPLAAAAIQFPLRHPAVSSVLVGARSAQEVAEDVQLLEFAIPEQLWLELDS